MELSELFLLAWACVATIFAVHFHHHLRKATRGGVVLCMMIEAIAEGKAELKKHFDGRITMDMGDREIVLKEVK